jgi:deazaflavin-dependent oxidoreductase (nitroreductase family)
MNELIPYPQGLARQILRAPILLHRAGLGDLVNAARILILTTRGRKTGVPRRTAVEYRRHGSKLYVVSAWGERPQWYQNILASPQVMIQLGRQRLSARATVVTDSGEALRVLLLFRRAFPAYYDTLIAKLAAAETVSPRTLPELTNQFNHAIRSAAQ